MSRCEHDIQKATCKQCKGSRICQHEKIRGQCKDCDLPKYILHKQRVNLRRLFKQSNLHKTQKTVEYTGCTNEQFINYMKSKMTADMTFENIHFDHIKPVSRFNLENEEELKMCCHYTNFQPLLAKDNLRKKNRWSDEEDKYWKENIIYIYNYS
jgi:hypothetical protein